jgi:repressor LexA
MLTKKQRDLLIYIHEHMKDSDIAPSFEEMKEALDLKSKSGIHRLISGLEERGFIERLPHRARALRILQLPEGYEAPAPQNNNVQHVNFNTPSFDNGEMAIVPLHGKIAAGTPIEAIRDEQTMIHIPAALMGRGQTYALTVDGDSMIKAGIHDGDTVIIERCQHASPGTIIVALVDGEEVTLKRLRHAGNKVVLEPENDTYEPQILEPSRVQVQGKLVGLMRTYH